MPMNNNPFAQLPTAKLVPRNVPVLDPCCGFPTAQSRVDIHQSRPVLVPMLQDSSLSSNAAPVARHGQPSTRLWLVALLLLAIAFACARYMLWP
jgi:hypothetical protein